MAVRINRDGTNAESMDKDAAAAEEDEGGGGGRPGSKKGFWSVEFDSFKGESAVDEAEEDDDGPLDSGGSKDGTGFDKSLGNELHGDKDGFWS